MPANDDEQQPDSREGDPFDFSSMVIQTEIGKKVAED